jgi:hypothetical protein
MPFRYEPAPQEMPAELPQGLMMRADAGATPQPETERNEQRPAQETRDTSKSARILGVVARTPRENAKWQASTT